MCGKEVQLSFCSCASNYYQEKESVKSGCCCGSRAVIRPPTTTATNGVVEEPTDNEKTKVGNEIKMANESIKRIKFLEYQSSVNGVVCGLL